MLRYGSTTGVGAEAEIPLYATEIDEPLMETPDVNSCAYGVAAEQPGSSMNVATWFGVTHPLNSMTCSLLLTASPGCRSLAAIADVMSLTNGANSPVTRPGGGSSQAQETRPEQSERYGSHAA